MTWAQDFFDDIFATAFFDTHPANDQDIAFLSSLIGGFEGKIVFDQCCGNGRMSKALLDKGAKLYGVDIVKSYIDAAQQVCPDGNFAADDAASYITPEKCDLALNWWTSFGYGKTPQDDIAVLKAAHKSLKPNSPFVLDIPNADFCRKLYAHNKIVTHTETIGDIKSTWDGWLSQDGKTLYKKWTYETADGAEHSRDGGGVRLYTAPKISTALKTAGFNTVECFGDANKTPLTEASRRMIVVALS